MTSVKSYNYASYGCHYSLAINYSWASYYSDEYSEDEYTDEEDSGSDYSSEEDYDAIYLNDNTRLWRCNNLVVSANTHTTPKNDRDRRATSVPVSSTRASEREKYAPRKQRAATCEARLLFAPSPGVKSPVAKGKEFEDYFKEGVERVQRKVTAKVEFQKKLNVTPGHGDKRKYCKPDAVFTKGRKGAIVEMKNYEGTRLGRAQIDKTYNDMCALEDTMKSSQVTGYIYVRHQTKVDPSVVDHARKCGISIVREGEVDADELAELVDKNLKI